MESLSRSLASARVDLNLRQVGADAKVILLSHDLVCGAFERKEARGAQEERRDRSGTPLTRKSRSLLVRMVALFARAVSAREPAALAALGTGTSKGAQAARRVVFWRWKSSA